MFVFFLVPCFLLLTDIDECVSGVHDCHRSASCANTVGSYTCTCNHPLAGDGKTCRYTAAGENFTLIVLQFRSRWLELSSNCPPNMMPKKKQKTDISCSLLSFVEWFEEKQFTKTNSWMAYLSRRWTNVSEFSFPSLISLPYWKESTVAIKRKHDSAMLFAISSLLQTRFDINVNHT